VVRNKLPREGSTPIADLVQGEVTVANEQLDDFILLRADGTPTYMLSVVVDDHDMGVTHVIRGDDHLNNAFRQYHLFKALYWEIPAFGHIPLIHGQDGQKLSKRHGALGVEAYREMGFLPEAMRNYLLRLGWSHGDAEIISTEQAIEWFDVGAIGRSAARFDLAKLESVNAHYMQAADNARLVALLAPFLEKEVGGPVGTEGRERLLAGMDGLKPRAKSLVELARNAAFYISRPQHPLANAKAQKMLADDAPAVLARVSGLLAGIGDWTATPIETAIRGYAEEHALGLGKIAQPLRAALSGSNASPGIFEVMEVLGKEETIARIRAVPGVTAEN